MASSDPEGLGYLGDPGLPTPRDLPGCVNAVAGRIQLEIIQDELPVVASSVRFDIDDDAARVAQAVAFADEYDRLGREGPLTPKAALELFAECHVGAEFHGRTALGQIRTHRRRRDEITLAAVRGGRSGLPAPIRGC